MLSSVTPIPKQFTILAEKPGEVLIAAYHNVSVVVWVGGATGAGVGLVDGTAPDQFAAHPEGLSLIHIITEPAGVPDSEAREAFVRQSRRYAPNISVVSIV